MIEYFDLLKGSTGAANQGDCFGDLLKECRESAKEKVVEEISKVTEQATSFICSKCGEEFDVYGEEEAKCPECGHIEESKKVNEQEPDPETERPEKPRPKPRREEPDPDAPPAPPEEVKDPEKPMEMKKEYLGKSEDVHYYFITTEGGEGIVDDFVIVDQEGVKKYSGRDQNIEVVEENIADFLIQAIRDINIAQIERSVFMKYIYPKLIEKEDEEEEVIEEPEEEEGKKKPLAPEEEEELPRESKKIESKVNEQKLTTKEQLEVALGLLSAAQEEEFKEICTEMEEDTNEKKKTPTCKKCDKKHWPFQKCKEAEGRDEQEKLQEDRGYHVEFDIADTVMAEDSAAISSSIKKALFKFGWDIRNLSVGTSHPRRESETSEKKKPPVCKKCNKAHWPFKKCGGVKESKLTEMKVTADDGSEFDVRLVGDGTKDTVIEVNRREFRFSPEFASMWMDDEGVLSEEGLRELTLDAISNLEEDDYNELVGQAKADDVEVEDADWAEQKKSTPGETDWPLKDRPTGEEEEKTIDDVDMSKPGPLHRPLKYRPKKKLAPEEEEPKEIGEPENEFESIDENSEDIEQELDTLDQMSIEELRDVVGEAAKRLPEKDDLIDAAMHDKFGDKYTKYLKQQVGLENKNNEGDNDMDEKKTIGDYEAAIPDFAKVVANAKKKEAEAKKALAQAEKDEAEAKKALAQAKKDEGINPKPEDSEETKIKKLSEEDEEINETDVAKGAKALIQLAKEALKDGDYQKAAEYCGKLAEIEAVVPAEAERE